MTKALEDMGTEFYRAYIAYHDMTEYTRFANNTDLIKDTVNSLYWNIKKKIVDDDNKFGLYLFLGIAIGAVFVIAILLLVIYFKRRKGDDEEAAPTTNLT